MEESKSTEAIADIAPTTVVDDVDPLDAFMSEVNKEVRGPIKFPTKVDSCF